MKKLAYVGMLLFAACSSTNNASNAQAATPARDPACAECASDCCQGEKAAAPKASCCQDQASAPVSAPKSN